MFSEQSATWLQRAKMLTPELATRRYVPIAIVMPEEDATAFQGWRMREVEPAETLATRWLHTGDSVVLDFGEHLVGKFSCSVHLSGCQDAPVRLKFTFGEVPAEIAEPFDPYHGDLSRAWLQDEIVTLDELPQTVTLSRRYAFRYLRITWEDYRNVFQIQLRDVACLASTSAEFDLPCANYPAPLNDIDQVGLRTLRNCMQEVFEDGPKRDRRLWLGDLRVMAQLNYLTFRNYDLVKRCLYLFAAAAREDGMVAGCVYEHPKLTYGNTLITYACLFGPTLLDYAEASDDWETARELWPVARRQVDFALQSVQDDGLFSDQKNSWIFFDWQADLDHQAPMHACLIYCLRALQTMATRLSMPEEATALAARINTLMTAARTLLWDHEHGCFVSGPTRQRSWCSQAWMVLAGVLSPVEATPVLQRMLVDPEAIRPNGPYLYHHVIEALLLAGLNEEAGNLLREYWGGMIARGATTFWEVFNPADDKLSPYGNHLINSYCHAWSSTPGYFLRKYPGILGSPDTDSAR